MQRLLILFGVILFSCNSQYPNEFKNNTVAKIGNDIITTVDIDTTIKQELFDELYKIYVLRKHALDQVLTNRLEKAEGEKYNLHRDSVFQNYVKDRYNSKFESDFINSNHLTNGIPSLTNTFKYLSLDSKEGQALLKERIIEYLHKNYIDSLKRVYNVKIFLAPPSNPIIYLSDLISHKKGNLNSKISFLVASDIECDMCRKHRVFVDSLYLKYKDKVCFIYTPFSSYVSLSLIAGECAAKQGKYWEMINILNKSKITENPNEFIKYAQELNLNIDEFKKDFYNPNMAKNLKSNFDNLIKAGLYGTPTVIINGITIQNSFSKQEIEEILKKEIEKI